MVQPRKLSLPLPSYNITEELSDQIGSDNPLAAEVAGPLFDAGINFAAITERPEFVRTEAWCRPWHVFYLVIQGRLRVEIEEQVFDLASGDLGFYPGGVPHLRTGQPGHAVQWLYIRMRDTPAWEPLKRHGPYSRPHESADLLFLLLRRILDAHRFRSATSIDLAQSHARALADLIRHEMAMIGHQPQRHTAPLQQLIDDIQKNPATRWETRTMAARLNVSVRKLYRLFHAEYGMPPREMVIKQRVARAAEALTRTDAKVGEIAESLGYQSIHSFSDLFKQHTGLRPTAYRKKFARLGHTSRLSSYPSRQS